MTEASARAHPEFVSVRGPRTALHLVERGHDPRRLEPNPDLFFRRPRLPLFTAGFIALIATTAVLYRELAINPARTTGHDMSWDLALALAIMPTILSGLLWVWWGWRLRTALRIRSGRASLAALRPDAEAEQAEAVRVSYGTDSTLTTSWHGVDVTVVARSGAGEVPFSNARTRTRWPSRDRIGRGDPISLWRGPGGWVFGQVASPGHDPHHTPPPPAGIPTWESLHDGHSPEYFRRGLMDLAARYRAGELTMAEYKEAERRLLGMD